MFLFGALLKKKLLVGSKRSGGLVWQVLSEHSKENMLSYDIQIWNRLLTLVPSCCYDVVISSMLKFENKNIVVLNKNQVVVQILTDENRGCAKRYHLKFSRNRDMLWCGNLIYSWQHSYAAGEQSNWTERETEAEDGVSFVVAYCFLKIGELLCWTRHRHPNRRHCHLHNKKWNTF